jgi:hypothetical protein
MEKVYLETTIPSYVTSKFSRDLVIAARQQISREWWDTARINFDIYISEVVITECSMGDPEAAKRRLDLISGLKILKMTDAVNKLAYGEVMTKLRNYNKQNGFFETILLTPNELMGRDNNG